MNKKSFPFLGFFILVALAITETALIASPQDASPVDAAPLGPLRVDAYGALASSQHIDGADFSVPVPAGFAGAALKSGDVVMTSRGARIDVKRIDLVQPSNCGARGDASAKMVRTEAWQGDGEGGCRVWMTLPRRHVIEAVVNHGAHAYVVTCASKDADVVQSVCAPVIGGLHIDAELTPTASTEAAPTTAPTTSTHRSAS